MSFLIERKPSQVELSYAAGIIDGEGYVGFMRSRNGGSFGGRVGIGHTNKSLCDWLAKMFGSHTLFKQGPRGNRRAQWNVFWDGRKARDLLQLLYAYLRIKRPQARILMSYFQIMDDYRLVHNLKKVFKRTPAMHGLQNQVYKRLTELNRQGDSWDS